MRQRFLLTTPWLLLVLLLAGGRAVLAQSGGNYTITSWTIDSGGGTSSGGSFELDGTMAQPDSITLMSGGGFELTGGFHSPGTTVPTVIAFLGGTTGEFPPPFLLLLFTGCLTAATWAVLRRRQAA